MFMLYVALISITGRFTSHHKESVSAVFPAVVGRLGPLLNLGGDHFEEDNEKL
jgi:hypothetical protein